MAPAPFPNFRAFPTSLQRSGWRTLLAGSVALSLILLAAAWGLTWQRLDSERQLVLRNTRSQQEALATIISENLTQVLDRGRLLSIAANEWFEGKPADAAKRLSTMRATDQAILRIALYDANHRQVYASTPAADSLSLKRAVQDALATAADGGRLRLAPPPEDYEQAWQLPLLFPVLGHRGQVHGILLVSIDLGYFLDLYRQIDIGPSGVIRILNQAHEILVEARPEGLVTRHQQPASLPTDLGHGSDSSHVVDNDGNAYLGSVQALDHYPLLVSISRQQAEVMAEHAGSRSRTLIVLLTLSLIIVLVTYWVGRSIRRQGQLLAALACADQEKQGLIQQLEEEKIRAFALAAHDPLTGLPNRRMFNELAISHLSRAKRSRKHYALLYVDLDRFKGINDTLGHHVGDLLLQTIAARLRAALRESDVIARLGGDEFALLLTGLDNLSDAALIAGKIVDQVGRPCLNLDGNDVQVTPSIGIALFPRDGRDFEALCRNADAAMYHAKRSGRGRYTFYEPALSPSDDRLMKLEQSLPKAIAEDELILHFQPRISLNDYRIVGLEALVRWQHPELGLIFPDELIALAERSGHMIALDNWVAAACCRQVAQWRAEGLKLVPVAINLSAKQLQDSTLPGRIARLLALHDLHAGWLNIEITEHSLVESIESAGQVLRELEKMGIAIALDDFGNGFSNLAHIRSLPIHSLKIDRSFVSDIRNSPDDGAIVASIITLAHNLHMRVVAEGVERLDQLVHLKTAGCDEVQGYYFSQPVPSDAARQLLTASRLPPP